LNDILLSREFNPLNVVSTSDSAKGLKPLEGVVGDDINVEM